MIMEKVKFDKSCTYARTYVYIILEEILENNRGSLLLEVNEFLQYVKEKFSGVLLPVDTITKQGLIGKGYLNIIMYCNVNCLGGSP